MVSTCPRKSIVKELFANSSKEISEVQKQIAELEPSLVSEWEIVAEAIDANNMNEAKVAALRYQSYFERYFALNSGLVNLYEKDIKNLKRTQSEYPISMSQQQQMSDALLPKVVYVVWRPFTTCEFSRRTSLMMRC